MATDPTKEDKEVESNSNSKPKKTEEQYFEVIFSAKTHANDHEDVMLGCNGEILNIKRETPVVLPKRFLEVADHASETKWKQLPGQPRKRVGVVKRYPYSVIGPAKKEDYEKAKREGTRKAIEAAERNLNADGSRNIS